MNHDSKQSIEIYYNFTGYETIKDFTRLLVPLCIPSLCRNEDKIFFFGSRGAPDIPIPEALGATLSVLNTIRDPPSHFQVVQLSSTFLDQASRSH